MAAHAAVVLAKTQATAARAETEQMSRQLRLAAQDLDAERAERERATAELSEVQAVNAELDKLRAVAEARAEEIRQQLAHERAQRSFLAQRIGTLERERDDLHGVPSAGSAGAASAGTRSSCSRVTPRPGSRPPARPTGPANRWVEPGPLADPSRPRPAR